MKAHDHPFAGKGEKALLLFVSLVGVGTVVGYGIAVAIDLMHRIKETLSEQE